MFNPLKFDINEITTELQNQSTNLFQLNQNYSNCQQQLYCTQPLSNCNFNQFEYLPKLY